MCRLHLYYYRIELLHKFHFAWLSLCSIYCIFIDEPRSIHDAKVVKFGDDADCDAYPFYTLSLSSAAWSDMKYDDHGLTSLSYEQWTPTHSEEEKVFEEKKNHES